MLVILILLTITVLSSVLHAPFELGRLAESLHNGCLRALPESLLHRASLEALVCGKNLTNAPLKNLLLQSSLIHIFVVSGTHFLLLHKILACVFRSRWIPFLPLAIYALATLCQPPGFRSFCFLLFVEAARHHKYFCSPVVLIFASALVSVAVFPEWASSRSLLMSLTAALVICVASEFWGDEKDTIPALFWSQSLIYFFMAFCLWGFSNLHPLSIAVNMILGPFIGLVIFPLALVVVAVPRLTPLFDALMEVLVWVLQKCSELLWGTSEVTPIPVAWQWALFLALLFAAYMFLVQRARRSIYEF